MFYYIVDLKIGNKIYPTLKLPSTSRQVAQLAAVKLRISKADPELSRLLRRLLTVSINGGVAVDLLERCQLKVGEVKLESKYFSRAILHLNNADIEESIIMKSLDVPLGNFLNYLDTTSNEASYCGLFWNQILNNLFRFGETLEMPANHRLVQEWNTMLLYKGQSITSRKVDLVSVIDFEGGTSSFTAPETVSEASDSRDLIPTRNKNVKIDEISIPMLTVEAGRLGFSKEGMHKDFGKTLGLISANCVTLAHHLVALGKKPEEAKVYGILIDGTNIQICTAHAIVTKLNISDNSYEIHANVTFDGHWFMSAIEPFSAEVQKQPPCSLPCCSFTQRPGLESLQPATSSINLSGVSLPESFSVELPDEDVMPSSKMEAISRSSFKKFTLNFTCFKRLKALVDCIKARINLLKSASDEIMDTSGREFINPDGQFYFSQANQTDADGNIQATPKKDKPAEHSKKDLKNVSKGAFNLIKSSRLEFAIYCECAAYFPSIFPIIYNMAEFDDKRIEYEFEKLLPFQAYICDRVNEEHSIIPLFRFALDCLFGLHALHETIGVIHRDISPSNIMFSEVDRVFKILDFDLSVRKSEMPASSNPGIGTRDFIAPESEQFGIYNEASDVYSLGMVMFSEFLPLLDGIVVDEGNSTQFIRIVGGMIDPDPLRRITVLGSIKEFIALLNQICPFASSINLGPNLARIRLLLLSHEENNVDLAGPPHLKNQQFAQKTETVAPNYSLIESHSHSHELQL